jgi:NDP-sugar pyrophosphorylase family protein
MKAVLYTGGKPSWADVLGDHPWALLPVGSRPLLSYWLELCIDLGITDVQIILGQDAEYIEMFCGNGEKWGLNINYSFVRAEDDSPAYLSRDPERWSDGLLYIGDALFPRRRADFTPDKLRTLLEGCCIRQDGRCPFFISRRPESVEHFIRTGQCNGAKCANPCDGTELCRIPEVCGIDFTSIRDVTHYYQLNMEIVRNEMNRYLSSGYSSRDGASIGYNVITPPSVTFTPPLAIGNDCRIGAISVIGPGTVISDHVLIDRQCEISDSIILSDTYVGRNLEIKGKIVAGNRIIDPEDGTCLEIEDPWLVAQTRPRNYIRDFLRAVFGWEFSLLLVILQVLPFVFFYSIIRLLGRGRFVDRRCRGIGGKEITVAHFVASSLEPSLLLLIFYGTSLDRFPQLLSVLSGKLWLCGQVPKAANGEELKDPQRYFPAVFSYSDAFIEIDKQMDALYYAHTRSLAADLRILRHALFARLVEVEFVSGTVTEPA